MKVETSQPTNITKPKEKLSKEEIQAKISAKFGKKAAPKAPKIVEDKVEIEDKTKNVDSKEFGDIKTNDPNSQVTQDKLKEILKTGAFQFNEKERKTLAKILK